MTFALSNKKTNSLICDETLDIDVTSNSMDFEEIFSDVQLLFDFKDDDDELISENGSNLTWSRDVVVCDPMMTDAVIKLTKSEPSEIIQTNNGFNDNPNTFNTQIDINCFNLSCEENSDSQLHTYSWMPTVKITDAIDSSNGVVITHNSKRRRQDSTDAFDYVPPYCDEQLPPRRMPAMEMQAYEITKGSCRSVQRSLIRPDALPPTVGNGSRHPVKYVVRRQDDNNAAGSIYVSSQNSTNCGGLFGPGSTNRPTLFCNRSSQRINNSATDSSSSTYVLYPPTPPSSTHCSSDSDDASSIGNAANHMCNNSSRTHPYGQLSMFDHCSSQSNELHLSEEERRTFIAEGFPIPLKFPLTKQEERCLKKVRRKIKNKISAQESRRKKKEYLESLEKKIEYYSREYGDMKRRCESLEANNKSLMFQLRNLQGVIGKASSSTGTCLMVFVLCFALLLGSSSKGESGDGSINTQIDVVSKVLPPSISILNSDGAALPKLWLPEWSPRLGYSRLKGFSHKHLESELLQCKAGPAEPLSNIPPSRVFFDADDEAYASYGPQIFNLWAGSIGATVSSTKCQMATDTNISLPLTPQPESMRNQNQSKPTRARLSLIWHGTKQATPLMNTTF